MKLIIILSLLMAAACGSAQIVPANGGNEPAITPTPTPTPIAAPKSGIDCVICDFDMASYKGALKKEEIDGLLLALNDEYHAWATYDGVNSAFGDPRPFVNIQRAEARHIDRLKQVFAAYGLAVPENKWIGKAPKFDSVAAACKAGVDAEIANRDLYGRLFKSTAREDILVVYRALQSASEQNHLPAFERCGSGGQGGGGGRGRRPF